MNLKTLLININTYMQQRTDMPAIYKKYENTPLYKIMGYKSSEDYMKNISIKMINTL